MKEEMEQLDAAEMTKLELGDGNLETTTMDSSAGCRDRNGIKRVLQQKH